MAKPRLLRRVGDDSARSFAVCADHVHFPLFVVSCSPNLVPNSRHWVAGGRDFSVARTSESSNQAGTSCNCPCCVQWPLVVDCSL